MIPILYESTETAFTSNGIGRLSDCVSCEVTEERNGEFEAEFTYPITGIHYEDIAEGRIILVDHDEQKDAQPFIIYRRSAPINGIVTFNAHHISYLLSSVIIEPFTASSVADAFNTFTTDNMNTNPFTFWTDNSTGGTMTSETPASVRSLLGGTQGSVLDVFGGEYKFDKFLVRNYAQRGTDRGVTIRYGKNLSDITWEVDTMDLYGSVVPFWSDGESTVVYGSIVSGSAATEKVTTLDLSSEFEEQPTVAQLETRAAAFLASNTPWIPKENIKINFIPLWQTEEYAGVAPLERVCLCDTVTVYYTDLGVQATAKVIKVAWDALIEKYTTIELGQAKSSFADTIIGEVDNKLSEAIANVPTTSAVQAAIDHATDLITGGMGGHIVFLYDADGKPTDMLVMDTDDVTTAVKVLRINVNGIGFSSTGVSGTFTSAWTLDGAFVADWITAGSLSANRIQGGTLTLGGTDNGNGVIVVYNASGTEIARLDKDGFNQIYNNVYVKLGNTMKPSTWSSNDIGVVSTPGFLVSYNNAVSQNTFAAATENGTVTETAWGTSSAATNEIGGTYSGGAYCWAQKYVGTEYVAWQFRAWKSGVGKKQIGMVLKPQEYFGMGQASGGSVTVNSTYPGFILNKSNNSIFAQSGTSSININGGGVVTVGSSGYSIQGPGGYPRIFSSSATYFWIGPSTSLYILNSGSNWTVHGSSVSGTIAIQGSSSKRYKHDITDQIDDELDAHRLYELEMKQFVYNDDFENWQYGDLKGRTLPGFIAEEVEEVYPSAAIHDEDGRVESWDERRIIPGMLKLIQEQHEEIEDLKARLAKLEKVVEALAIK